VSQGLAGVAGEGDGGAHLVAGAVALAEEVDRLEDPRGLVVVDLDGALGQHPASQDRLELVADAEGGVAALGGEVSRPEIPGVEPDRLAGAVEGLVHPGRVGDHGVREGDRPWRGLAREEWPMKVVFVHSLSGDHPHGDSPYRSWAHGSAPLSV